MSISGLLLGLTFLYGLMNHRLEISLELLARTSSLLHRSQVVSAVTLTRVKHVHVFDWTHNHSAKHCLINYQLFPSICQKQPQQSHTDMHNFAGGSNSSLRISGNTYSGLTLASSGRYWEEIIERNVVKLDKFGIRSGISRHNTGESWYGCDRYIRRVGIKVVLLSNE